MNRCPSVLQRTPICLLARPGRIALPAISRDGKWMFRSVPSIRTVRSSLPVGDGAIGKRSARPCRRTEDGTSCPHCSPCGENVACLLATGAPSDTRALVGFHASRCPHPALCLAAVIAIVESKMPIKVAGDNTHFRDDSGRPSASSALSVQTMNTPRRLCYEIVGSSPEHGTRDGDLQLRI